MQGIPGLLRQRARLSTGAMKLTCDMNEAYLLVHRVMADAMRTGARSEGELNFALAAQFEQMNGVAGSADIRRTCGLPKE
jgi:hypothetical protein